MCALTAAALMLAALAALPCRGTDADASSKLKETDTAHGKELQPTVNKLYLMLHTKSMENASNSFSDYIQTDLNLLFNLTHQKTSVEQHVKNNNEHDIIRNGDIVGIQTNNNTKNCLVVEVTRDGAKKRDKRRRALKRNEYVNSDTNNLEVTTISLPSPPPLIMEWKKKSGETGSSAPLLNYIFDTYSNTHQHRNERPGNGNSIYAAAAPEIEALVGSTAYLDCKVDALHDKLVSWVRRKNEDEPMELLTTGMQQYTADNRYSARFIPPDIWRLEVKEVRPTDAAHYDCQLSAHPPRTARVTLRVPEVSVRIVDGAGAEVSEQVCEVGSTVTLRCEVRGLRMEGGPSLLWYRREALLNDDTTRGGISVRTELGANGADSVLRVARVRNADAGRYSCTVARPPPPAPPAPPPPPAPPDAHVVLHVIKGESLAELHQGGGAVTSASTILSTMLTLGLILS